MLWLLAKALKRMRVVATDRWMRSISFAHQRCARCMCLGHQRCALRIKGTQGAPKVILNSVMKSVSLLFCRTLKVWATARRVELFPIKWSCHEKCSLHDSHMFSFLGTCCLEPRPYLGHKTVSLLPWLDLKPWAPLRPGVDLPPLPVCSQGAPLNASLQPSPRGRSWVHLH